MNAPPRRTLRAARGYRLGHLADLIAVFDAARSGHDDHVIAADFDIADLDHGARGFEVAAGQLVGRNDAMAFLDARHHFEIDGVHIADRADAAQHRVHHAGRAMDDEAHGYQPVDHLLGLRLFGAFLHDYEHELPIYRARKCRGGTLRPALPRGHVHSNVMERVPSYNRDLQKPDAIIIGAGHNGLVSAAYLARAGRRVLVLERRELVGGCAVTEEIWPGYRVSTASYLTSLLQERVVRDLELARFGYRVDAKDPAFFSPFPDGRYLFMWQDRAKTLAEIAKFSRRDAEVYPAYEEHLERLSQVVEWLLLTTPPEFPPRGIGDFIEYLKLAGKMRGLSPKEIVGLVKIFTQSAAEFLDEWFESERSQSDARHRRRDRRERRTALARHRLHPAASLHGRRGRTSRIVGLRARRHGRGLERHRRIGAQPRRGDPHQCARGAHQDCQRPRARRGAGGRGRDRRAVS